MLSVHIAILHNAICTPHIKNNKRQYMFLENTKRYYGKKISDDVIASLNTADARFDRKSMHTNLVQAK